MGVVERPCRIAAESGCVCLMGEKTRGRECVRAEEGCGRPNLSRTTAGRSVRIREKVPANKNVVVTMVRLRAGVSVFQRSSFGCFKIVGPVEPGLTGSVYRRSSPSTCGSTGAPEKRWGPRHIRLLPDTHVV